MYLSGSVRLCFAAIVLLACARAKADDSTWYVGSTVGRSESTIDNVSISSGLLNAGVATSSIADGNRDTGYELLGGYQLNHYLAFESGYFDLGKFDFDATTMPAGALNGNIKLNGFNLDTVAILPLTNGASAFARGGAIVAQARNAFNETGSLNLMDPDTHKRSAGYKFGAGLQYAFTDSVDMHLQAERYRVDDVFGNRGNIDLISLGLVYRFGEKEPAHVARPSKPALTPPPAPMPDAE